MRKNTKVKFIMNCILVSGCKAEAATGRCPSPFPPPITTGLAIKLQYACEYIIDVETAIPIMPQTFYTFEVCGYRVIIPYNTFPSLGCTGCHKKWFVQVPSYRSYVNRYLKYIVFYTWSPSLLRICSNKNNWIV